MMDSHYRERRLDQTLSGLVTSFPALLLTGPRATGKSTSASRVCHESVRLDRPPEAAIALADPDAALADRLRPTLIDEWQVVPSVLGAVKRHVDIDSTPGQFVITGSTRADLDSPTWPGTGRLVRIAMYGLTVAERRGTIDAPTLVDIVARDGVAAVSSPRDPPDLRGYVRELLVSGFPYAATSLTTSERERWLESYIDQVVTRDAEIVDPGRDATRLRRFFLALAVNTAGVVDDITLLRAAGVNRVTGSAYERLLAGLSLVDAVPAWWSNRLKRLAQRPKRYIVDAALAAAAMGVDEGAIMNDGDVLGRLLDTFVVAQLRADAESSQTRHRLFHLRTHQGRHEVDLVIELPQQRILAAEIKATAAPTKDDARHLAWLRHELGERFVGGIVFHTGPRAFVLDDDISAIPIASLWS